MGKKAVSLRKLFAQKAAGAGSDRSSLGKRQSAQPTAEPSKKDHKKGNKKGKSSDDSEEVDWELLEKQQQEDSKGDSSDDEDSEGSEEGDGIRLDGSLEHEIEDYTFEFNDMRAEYAEGITTMLRKFISNPTEAYNLATVVTSQTIVGTVVNSEGGHDSFAFATVLPFRKLEKVGPLNYILHSLQVGLDKALRTPSEELQLLRDYLPAQASTGASASTSTAAEKSSEKGTAKASQGTRTGLLLHKRFTNLPIQLVGALHRNLEEDISWAQQQASDEDDELALEASSSSQSSASKPTPTKKKSTTQPVNFFADARYVLLFCECAVSKEGKSGYDLSENTCYSVLGSCSDIIFACYEDEVYLQHAAAAVLFRPPKQHCLTDLVALLVPISKLKNCVNGICELIPTEV